MAIGLNSAAIQAHLGEPDLVYRHSAGAFWAYYYDRFSKKDWVVTVNFDANYRMLDIGFNGKEGLEGIPWQSFSAANNVAKPGAVP